MSRQVIQCGLAEQPLPGEKESGDRCVIQLASDRATVAVIDGLGHGSEAALAAQAAADILETHSHEAILPLVKRCHERLRSTRGAAMTVVRFDVDRHAIEWVGVGNVRTVLFSSDQTGELEHRDMLVYGGTVGIHLPRIAISTLGARRGDLVILATDGVRGDFTEALQYHEDPQPQANRLLEDYRSLTDDALVLVTRLLQ